MGCVILESSGARLGGGNVERELCGRRLSFKGKKFFKARRFRNQGSK